MIETVIATVVSAILPEIVAEATGDCCAAWNDPFGSPSALKGQARASAQLLKLMQQYGMLNEVDYKTNELMVRFMKIGFETFAQ